MVEKSMTYAGLGVDYSAMDPFKRLAQKEAASTDHLIERFGFKVMEWSRGESAFLIDTPWGYLAFVIEGLGTKNLVADAMYEMAKTVLWLTGKSYYDNVAQCAVAMIVNDMITLGALPVTLGQYFAVGNSDWFKDEDRSNDLIHGWKKACVLARCSWGPGETPTLKGLIIPGASDLSGAAMGWIADKNKVFNPEKIAHGDTIIFISSSGIHANGLTLARSIADKLPEGYLTKLSDGRTYGETLLDPTKIYVGPVEDMLKHGIDIHYAVNITGHGWRKLMRAPQPFTYVIEHLPRQLPIFNFIQEHGPVDDYEAYGNLNMGAGFALYIPEADVRKLFGMLETYDTQERLEVLQAGHVERSTEKKVIIKPKNLEYLGNTLAVR